MPSDPAVHHRRSIRLQGYDYALAGAYFVTLVAQDRKDLWGEITGEQVHLSPAGQMVEIWWLELEKKFPYCQLDIYTIMPNHFHGILWILPGLGEKGVETQLDPNGQPDPNGQIDRKEKGVSLPETIQWFKAMTTNAYIRGVKTLGWPEFRKRVWQRNYYERIIRNEKELDRIRQYIENNPLRWAEDSENRPWN